MCLRKLARPGSSVAAIHENGEVARMSLRACSRRCVARAAIHKTS